MRRELLLVPQSLDDDPEARVGVVSEPVDTGDREVAKNIDGSDATKKVRQRRDKQGRNA
jgi:hypothetical protein